MFTQHVSAPCKLYCIHFTHKTRALRKAQTPLTKAAHYPHIAKIPDLERQYGDPDHLQFLINCSLYHCKAILKFSSKSTHNVLSMARFPIGQSAW